VCLRNIHNYLNPLANISPFTKKRKKKMSNTKNAMIFALFLLLTIAITSFALPIANAHDPAWQIPTYAYIAATPNPVGAGQTVSLVFWLDKVPPTAAGTAGDRWINFNIDVTKPDGSKETLGPFTSDSVGGAYTTYTPDTTGNYTLFFSFPGQVPTGSTGTGISGTSPNIGDNYLPSNTTTTLTVQQEPIPGPTSYPLPTEYWTRPIEGQNTEWYTLASNWLGSWPGNGGIGIVGRVQPDGIAPNSAHIMWTKPFEFGGVVGGNYTIPSMTFYSGTEYEGKFRNGVVLMNGNLYYELPKSNDVTGGGYACVDLLTGDQLWWQNISASFGQLYDYESFNQHGVIPNGYLWSTPGGSFMLGMGMGAGTWNAYDPLNGNKLFTLTDVPSGTISYGPNGEILIYKLDVTNNWLALWNNTAAPELTAAGVAGTGSSNYQWRPVGKTVNMSKAYSWNVTLPTLPAGSSILKVIPDDLILGSTGNFGGTGATVHDGTAWAISLKPSSRGQLLWMKSYTAPAGNITRAITSAADAGTRVFTMYDKETMQWWGYSLDSGNYLWGPTASEDAWNFYSGPTGTVGVFGTGSYTVAYGKLYTTGLAGKIYCRDLKDGSLLWTYKVPSNFDIQYGDYPMLIGAIADGKIYTCTSIHSANAPAYKGITVRCINATDGNEIWNVMGWGADGTQVVADGYMVYLNLYDMQIYCIGKGPSDTTVTASPKVSMQGNSVLVEGTVIDTAAGTKQNEQAADFPNGVPCVSDDSQSEWMEYVYMQKPKPTNATGVPVSIDAIDPNNNFVHLGDTHSDSRGQYAFQVDPSMLTAGPGLYTVIASFAGSNSYYPSNAETSFVVNTAPTAAPTSTPQSNLATGSELMTYILVATIAIIIAIAIVGVLILRKRP
jgi:hypothetical protein